MAGRVLLLMPTSTYRVDDFLQAADRLGVEVVIGSERKQALEDASPGHTLTLDFLRPEWSVETITRNAPFDAVLGLDDETTVLAAMAGEALGLAHNARASAEAARDKYETRCRLAAAGRPGPGFCRVPVGGDASEIADRVHYPCVLKPLFLSASRGVLRTDDPRGFVAAFERVAAILRGKDIARRRGDAGHILVEDYLEGPEFALEGLLDRGRLQVLALLDKPDPLEGPTFEETMFLTPSRLDGATQTAIAHETEEGCRALGLRTGPIHAELRLYNGRPWLLEIAARTIGGLCSRALRFGPGITLEELVLRHALELELPELPDDGAASGVMMLPIPRPGRLRGVSGLDRARRVQGIREVTLTTRVGSELLPLPEGHRYLGFVFASGESADAVERSLREAHAAIELDIGD